MKESPKSNYHEYVLETCKDHRLERNFKQLQITTKLPTDGPTVEDNHTTEDHCLTEITNLATEIKWKRGEDAPIKLARGGTATKGNMIYFYDESGKMASYDFITKAWYVLPKCPSKVELQLEKQKKI